MLKYNDNKKMYLLLNGMNGGDNNRITNLTQIIEDQYDKAIECFGNKYIIIDSDPYKIFRLHWLGEDKRYEPERYKELVLQCEGKKYIIKNPDATFDLIKKYKNSIFTDTWIDHLPINDSVGKTRWESYNWTLHRDQDNKFHITFGRIDDSFKAEIGTKHTMLGQGNDFYAGGEMRLVKNENKLDQWIVQINLDSSSFSPGIANIFKNLCKSKNNGLGETERNIICDNFEKKYNDMMDFKIIGNVKNQPPNHFDDVSKCSKYHELQKIMDQIIQCIRNTVKRIFKKITKNKNYKIQMVGSKKWYNIGLNGSRALHWHYHNEKCPTDIYIDEINEMSKKINQDFLIKKN